MRWDRLAIGVLSLVAVAMFASGAILLQRRLKGNPATAQKGPLPAGWTGRTDTPIELLASANIRSMGRGIHVITGPAVTLWNPEHTASGTYTISATFGTQKNPPHDGLGLVWGGENLDTDRATYANFVVFSNGAFAIEHRVGRSVHILVDKNNNVNAAIRPADATGAASNALEVRVGSDSVRFVANGQQLHALSAQNPMAPTSGIYGLRVNRNINVHIAEFGKK